MGLLRRARHAMSGVTHLGNTAHAVHGPRNPKPPNPIRSGQRMANHIQAPHKPDDNPYGIRQAQLNDARRALASSQPARRSFPQQKSINRAKKSTTKANFAGYKF